MNFDSRGVLCPKESWSEKVFLHLSSQKWSVLVTWKFGEIVTFKTNSFNILKAKVDNGWTTDKG